jgi:hypothetical protein
MLFVVAAVAETQRHKTVALVKAAGTGVGSKGEQAQQPWQRLFGVIEQGRPEAAADECRVDRHLLDPGDFCVGIDRHRRRH